MNAMRKVLVVDDDPVVSKSFDRVLARKGYVVISAENGTGGAEQGRARGLRRRVHRHQDAGWDGRDRGGGAVAGEAAVDPGGDHHRLWLG